MVMNEKMMNKANNVLITYIHTYSSYPTITSRGDIQYAIISHVNIRIPLYYWIYFLANVRYNAF